MNLIFLLNSLPFAVLRLALHIISGALLSPRAELPFAMKSLHNLFYWTDTVVCFAFGAFVFRRSRSDFRRIFGLALASVGFVLWLVARWQIGASFSVTAQAKHLATAGLYPKIRNPICFFRGLAGAGLWLALGGWLFLLGSLLLDSTQLFRIR